jgi:hypothetical protein
MGKVARASQKHLYPLQVPGHFLGDLAIQRQTRQRLKRRFYPVLHLDQVLASRAVAGLQLQVAGDDPVVSGLNPG